MIHEYRDVKHPTRLFQPVRIDIHIRSNDRDVTVAVSLLPDKTPDTLCHELRFPPRVTSFMEGDRAVLMFPRRPAAAVRIPGLPLLFSSAVCAPAVTEQL